MSALPLELRGAGVRRDGRLLVGPVDLRLEGTGVTAVIGPNGSGKSMLLRLMHGLERPVGRVDWALPEAEARARQALVAQRPIVLRRSVRANLAFPLRLAGLSRAASRARAEAQAAAFDLGEQLAQRATSLSGGEAQRLALARALITDPEVLFADEPCAALDGRATRAIEARLARAAATTHVVLATHDMGQARRIATRVVFMLHGRVAEAGPAAAFFAGPRTPQAAAFLKGDIVE
ncbi:ATP-binding cassette domain-containing protein [Jannaschia sp. GRR-S6-38]|uniref:ATP-binding cassette domain-containing protein n=1 Tax=Jannaschia ovalis TaxID=3038773 RepID=A0ABY8L7G1_9RHOB|nr:ATP-binding cassette domain-containing protein [Jannaschia sp. GRR-S6-38]WGH77318.1 ATP-binding cassette domain-containing protein [Jannaschia sp. GRR-S6-38]